MVVVRPFITLTLTASQRPSSVHFSILCCLSAVYTASTRHGKKVARRDAGHSHQKTPPQQGKLSRAVLRGREASDGLLLPDNWAVPVPPASKGNSPCGSAGCRPQPVLGREDLAGAGGEGDEAAGLVVAIDRDNPPCSGQVFFPQRCPTCCGRCLTAPPRLSISEREG